MLHKLKNVAVTLLLWSYFTIGFICFFAPFYLYCFCFVSDKKAAFQRLNHRFYKVFFCLCRILIPHCKWQIDDAVQRIRGAVIVCNHLSYLDSILLISLFKRHTTIVKNRLLKIPLFGTMLKLSGYLPADSSQGLAGLMVARMNEMPDFFASGGVLFIFPEGTRSRNGEVGRLNPGAFKIARLYGVPIKVITVSDTHRLFPPGKFWFDTNSKIRITLNYLEEFKLNQSKDQLVKGMQRVTSLFSEYSAISLNDG